MLTKHDIEIVRPLLHQYAEIAALPIQEEKRKLWRDHNERRSARPMILIDQICWQQLNGEGELDTHCEDPFWDSVECGLRMRLYIMKHFPGDRILTPYYCLPKPLHDSGWGLERQEHTTQSDPTSNIVSHEYIDVLSDWDDLEKIKMPVITLDEKRQKEIEEEADIMFDGIMPYYMTGRSLHLGIWDTVSMLKGVTNCYMDLIDQPEFLHAVMEKFTQGILSQIQQINELKAYDVTRQQVHCSCTIMDNLPNKDCDYEHGTTDQGWAFGMAQLFQSVSPEVTEEFEIPYMNRLFPHFGAIYYGCCERLDDRLDIISKLINVRKISCSPWSDRDHFAEVLPDRYIMSAKPSPALLAADSFDEDAIRKDLRATMDAAKRYHHNVELIQKDISTIRNEPYRLDRWCEIAMEEAMR